MAEKITIAHLVNHDPKWRTKVCTWLEGVVREEVPAHKAVDSNVQSPDSPIEDSLCKDGNDDMHSRNAELASSLHSARTTIFQLNARVSEHEEVARRATDVRDNAIREAASLRMSLNSAVFELQAVHKDRTVAWDAIRAIENWESDCVEGKEKAFIRKLVTQNKYKDIHIMYLKNKLDGLQIT